MKGFEINCEIFEYKTRTQLDNCFPFDWYKYMSDGEMET